MIIFISALAAIIPMSLYLIIIWRFDRYEREPFKLVLANYFWGALGAVALALIASFAVNSFASLLIKDKIQLEHFGSMAIAPVVEEITKGLFLLITMSSRKFDNILDGIVYGGAIGLGFGMTENFLYFVTYNSSLPNWIALMVIRSLFSGVMHCLSTASLGAFLGLAKFQSKIFKYITAFFGLFLAIGIHSIWNTTLSVDGIEYVGFVFLISSVFIFAIIFKVSLNRERKLILNELEEETEIGTIPKAHLQILSSSQRERKGWFDERNRKLYINAATTLAFRKIQARKSSGVSKTYYEQDIINFRKFITNLLTNSQSV